MTQVTKRVFKVKLKIAVGGGGAGLPFQGYNETNMTEIVKAAIMGDEQLDVVKIKVKCKGDRVYGKKEK